MSYSIKLALLVYLASICYAASSTDPTTTYNEAKAVEFYENYLKNAERLVQEIMKIRWNMLTNMNEENRKAFENITTYSAQFSRHQMSQIRKFDWRSFKNSTLKRGFFRAISLMGDSGLSNENDVVKWKRLKVEMSRVFTTARVHLNTSMLSRNHHDKKHHSEHDDHHHHHNSHPQTLVFSLEPNLTSVFQTSRDYTYLAVLWKLWRDSSGKKMLHLYPDFANLSNEATREYGFTDYGQFLRSNYEVNDLEEQFEAIYAKLTKIYRLLHSYVRKKLKEMYPHKIDENLSVLPAHVFGDMYAQQWHNLFEDIKPYKNKPLLDVTKAMVHKNMTVEKMFHVADEFFVSLGLNPLPKSFWENSLLIKPDDKREINCHPSAWDFYNGKDYRIKMCAQVTMSDLFTIHHEMGHIQYYMNYQKQPFQFKEGANPGFHEALGDLMSLSVMTPAHLRKLNLLQDYTEDKELDINFLLFSALRNIALAPFALIVDKWRWNVFSGRVKPDEYNQEWWRLRCKYQGLVPPVNRFHDDFDPGSKYHIASNVPYDRYFASLILTFQFHQALCRTSGHKGPLHKCDIYQSKEAGAKLKKMMAKGSSEPWQNVLKELTDGQTDRLDAGPMLEYFQPLLDWLVKQNLTENEWQCDQYFDKSQNMIKSYSHFTQINHHSKSTADVALTATISTSSSTVVPTSCAALVYLIVLVFLAFYGFN